MVLRALLNEVTQDKRAQNKVEFVIFNDFESLQLVVDLSSKIGDLLHNLYHDLFQIFDSRTYLWNEAHDLSSLLVLVLLQIELDHESQHLSADSLVNIDELGLQKGALFVDLIQECVHHGRYQILKALLAVIVSLDQIVVLVQQECFGL